MLAFQDVRLARIVIESDKIILHAVVTRLGRRGGTMLIHDRSGMFNLSSCMVSRYVDLLLSVETLGEPSLSAAQCATLCISRPCSAVSGIMDLKTLDLFLRSD